MGWLDRILGTERHAEGQPARQSETRRVAAPAPGSDARISDTQALDRYRYMIKTAPPETVEAAHAEAFAQLTPEQRRQVLAELANAAPPGERAAARATSPDDPRAMGRLATRTELRQPGFMERTFGPGGGMGLGGSLLGSFAMGFVGSMVANSFFSALHGFGDTDAPVEDHHLADDEAQEDAPPDDAGGDADLGGMDDMDMGGDFDV